ncbi:MAG: sensor domain-containing diguanylate cyclase [Nitrospirae bacterium]|nr:sensor domain-containing diguanylate cyclase [Nitrospirota bacterium]
MSTGTLLRTLKAENAYLRALLEISDTAVATFDPHAILHSITRKIALVTKARRCSIVEVSPRTREATVVASSEDPEIRNLKIDLRKYPELRRVMKTREVLYVPNIDRNTLFKPVRPLIRHLGLSSMLLIPIFLRRNLLGVLFLRAAKSQGRFDADELRFCRMAANIASQSLSHTGVYRTLERKTHTLERLAITDGLTGVYNHRYLYTRLDEEFARAARYQSPLSLIMVDLDDFKRVNDTFGHRRGDEVLKDVAATIRRAVRRSDIVTRYGGEEFVILLPQTPLSGSFQEAERIREAVGRRRFRGLGHPITISLGLAAYPENQPRRGDDLLKLADQAMYQAKAKGKNRVIVASDMAVKPRRQARKTRKT